MKMKLSEKWANALTYVAAYAGITPFVLVGGFLMLKSPRETVRKTLKNALLVFLIFLACEAAVSLMSQISSITDLDFYPFLPVFNGLIRIAEIVVYTVFFVLALRRGSDEDALSE